MTASQPDAIAAEHGTATAPRPRNVWWLTISMFFIRIGTTTTAVAMPLFVIQRYGLGLGAGLAMGLRLAPNIVFGPIVGSVVDRFEPRRVAILGSVGSGVVVGLFPLTGALWQVQVLSALGGVAYMVGYPARMALRPLAMAEGTTVKGNSMLITSERLATLLGPVTAGPIIALVGIAWLFRIEVLVALAAAIFIVLLPKADMDRRSAGEESGGAAGRGLGRVVRIVVDGLREMLVIVRRDSMMVALTVTAFTYVTALGINTTFLSKYSLDHFPHIPGAYGYLVAALGAGGVAGGLTAGRLHRLHQGRLYLLENVAEGAIWLVLIAAAWMVSIAIALVFLVGFFESAATVVYFAEVQKRIPQDHTGRYYATFVPLTDIFTMAGTTVGPILVGGIGLRQTAAVICGLIAVPVLLFTRTLAASRAV